MRIFFLLLIILLLAACIESAKTNEITVKAGDVVCVDYIETLEDGKLIDTTIKEIGENTGIEKVEWYDRKNYGCINITVGLGVYPFEDSLIGMRKNESKIVVIPPDKAYGDRSEELIITTPRQTTFPKIMRFELEEFIKGTGVYPTPNSTVKMKYWSVRVLNVSGDSVIIEHLIENNAVNTPLGEIEMYSNGTHVTVELNPIINKTVKLNSKFAKVISVNKTHVTIDYNHPLAGKKLIFKLIVRDIMRGWPSG